MRRFAFLILALAALARVAYGAQPHVHVVLGETLTVSMCGLPTEPGRTETIVLSEGEPAQDTSQECCGDCVGAVAAAPPEWRLDPPLFATVATQPVIVRESPETRPIWPGAPPIGPPLNV